jgi:hypothetical protein
VPASPASVQSRLKIASVRICPLSRYRTYPTTRATGEVNAKFWSQSRKKGRFEPPTRILATVPASYKSSQVAKSERNCRQRDSMVALSGQRTTSVTANRDMLRPVQVRAAQRFTGSEPDASLKANSDVSRWPKAPPILHGLLSLALAIELNVTLDTGPEAIV